MGDFSSLRGLLRLGFFGYLALLGSSPHPHFNAASQEAGNKLQEETLLLFKDLALP